MELRIDRIACDGVGVCAELLPELITLDEWGYPIVKNDRVPVKSRHHARRAVGLCPALALRLNRMPARSPVTPSRAAGCRRPPSRSRDWWGL